MSGDSGTLRVELLGPVRAWRDDRELPAGGARRRGVLGMLAMRAGHAVPRAEIISGVWGAPPPWPAVNILPLHIAGLRRVLEPRRAAPGPGVLRPASGPGYLLRLAPGAVDTGQLDEDVAEARRCCASGDLARAERALDVALGRFRGSPLDGIPGPWASLERPRLAELRLVLLEERIETMLARGHHHEAVPVLAGLTGAYPLRERFLGQLMVALYRSGQQAEALARFATARQLLARRFGIEPGPGLRRLQLQILTSDTTLMTLLPPGSGLPGARTRVFSVLSH